MVVIDNIRWDVPCDITRTAEMQASEISGMLLNRNYFNDVIGTYMTYDITMAVPTTKMDEYARLYDVLTDPVASHRFVLPYNAGTIELEARVESVQDVYVYVTRAKQYWRGVSFSVIANHPTKAKTLGDVVMFGMYDVPNITVGGNGLATRYDDYDEVYF